MKSCKIFLVAASIFALVFLVGVCFGLSERQPKISVVIPVYNTEPYLEKCLESVEKQTLKNIEIICVNDGSTDNSATILENHKNKDKRIKIITQENAGLAEARNVGMAAAIGEYIAFLDSDDFMLPHAYKLLYGTAKKYDVDVLEFGVYVFSDGTEFDMSQVTYDFSKITFQKKMDGQNPFEVLNLGQCTVWNKLWKNSFIKENNLKFKKGIMPGEDTLFNWVSLSMVRKCARDANKLYCYRSNRKGSIMDNIKTMETIDNSIDMIQEVISHYPERFNFKGGDIKVIDIIFYLTYDKILHGLNENDRVYYSQKIVKIVENFVNRYNVDLPENYVTSLNNLKQAAIKN